MGFDFENWSSCENLVPLIYLSRDRSERYCDLCSLQVMYGISRIIVFHYKIKELKILICPRHELRSTFNFLLMALLFFDSCMMIGWIYSVYIGYFYFAMSQHWHNLLYLGWEFAETLTGMLTAALPVERCLALRR